MPLTVEFKNIKVNECYQYFDRGINGAVVQTKVDETWSSVVSVNGIIEGLETEYFRRQIQRALDGIEIYNSSSGDVDEFLEIFTCCRRLFPTAPHRARVIEQGK